MQLCATLGRRTLLTRSPHDLVVILLTGQGRYPVQLGATLDPQAKYLTNISIVDSFSTLMRDVPTIHESDIRTSPTPPHMTEQPPEQGHYTVQLCATLDRQALLGRTTVIP